MNDFINMDLEDSFDEKKFEELGLKRKKLKSDDGTRKHNVNVRPLQAGEVAQKNANSLQS